MPGCILIVDDDRAMCEMLAADLSMRGFEPTWTTAPDQALEMVAASNYEAVLTDLKMPHLRGTELCALIVAQWPEIPVVVMTAFGSMETAIEAMRAGAYDFVTKPVEMDILALVLQRAVNHHQLQDKVRQLSQKVDQLQHFDELLGTSKVMQELYHQLERVAKTDASVLITGESGVGKELVARAIHKHSPRADGPFVAVNCAALSETLLESELFGHVEGAFTDARSARAGLFLQANNGTLLLDEIGDFPLSMQAKLLRALEQQQLRPVGGDQDISFDVRILCATNRDLDAAVEEGRFRNDLFFRINVIQLSLPPLRARGADILLLAQHFADYFAARSDKPVRGISEPVAEKLLNYPWPGNVRELRNVIERAVALTQHEQLVISDLPDKIRNYQATQLLIDGTDPGTLLPLEEIERRYIRHVLEATGNNRTWAARILGIDRKTLYRKLKLH